MAKSSRSWFSVGLYLDILPSFHTLLCAWFAESTKNRRSRSRIQVSQHFLILALFSLSRPLNLQAQSYFLLNKVVLVQGDGQRCVCKKIAYSGKRKKPSCSGIALPTSAALERMCAHFTPLSRVESEKGRETRKTLRV